AIIGDLQNSTSVEAGWIVALQRFARSSQLQQNGFRTTSSGGGPIAPLRKRQTRKEIANRCDVRHRSINPMRISCNRRKRRQDNSRSWPNRPPLPNGRDAERSDHNSV